MSTNHEPQHTGRHPTFMQYAVIAVFLFAITMVEFVLIWDRAGIEPYLGASKIPLLIGLSAIKFVIVIMFYMHLRFDARLFSGIFLAGMALAVVVGIAVLGLFVAYQGNPREFAEERRVPFVHAEGDTSHDSGEEAVSNTLHLGVVGDTFEFDTTSYRASSGSEIVLTLDNTSAINQHIWVLVQAGTKDDVAADGAAAGPANDWVPPNDPRILARTGLLDPGESEELRFTAPAGTYQFVCTFPGHNLTMFGDFEVVP